MKELHEYVASRIFGCKAKHGAALGQGRNSTIEVQQILGGWLGRKLLGINDGLLEGVTLVGWHFGVEFFQLSWWKREV